MRRLGLAVALAALSLGALLSTSAHAAVLRGDPAVRAGAVASDTQIVPVRDHDGDGDHHRGGGDWHGRQGHGGWDRGRRGDWDDRRWHGGHSNFSLFFDLSPPRYYAPPPARCQPFVQNGWWYGRPAQIGSTMCYDAWGNSYVVDGSAYVIQFLDGRPW